MNPDTEISFEDYLDQKPCLEELLKYIDVDNVWIMFGLMLQMDKKDLSKLPNEAAKPQAAIELWLGTPGASRRQLLETLRNGSDFADNYEKRLKEDYETSANSETGAEERCQLVTGRREEQSSHVDNQVEKPKISLSSALDHINELKEKLANLTAAIKRKEFDIVESNSMIQELQAVISRNEEELASLQQSLIAKEHDNEIFVQEINNTEKELASFRELSENRLQEVEQLKLKLNDTEEELELSENRLQEVEQLKLKLNDTEEELASFRDLSENRLQEVEQLKLKLNNTEKELASFRELSENRLQEVEQLKLKLKLNDNEEELASFRDLSENRLQEVEQLKLKLNDTEEESASFRELSENRLQEVEQLKLKLNDTEEEFASFRELSENRLKDVTRSVNELSEKLETQQKINRVKRLENEDLRSNIKEKDEKIAGTEEQLASVRELLEGRKRETEKLELKIQKITDERELLQERLSLMSQELMEREETIKSTVNENEGIKTTLKSMERQLSDKERQLSDKDRQIKELQTPVDITRVIWRSTEVQLVTPTVEECTEVIAKLEDKHQNIYLRNSSSDIAQVLIPPLLEKDHIIAFYVSSTPLTQDFLLTFSHQMSGNNTLQTLSLTNDSINDEGVSTLIQSLKHNKKLLYLSLEFNRGITSACVPSLADFIRANCTLSVLYLSCTNIDANGVRILVDSLKTNMTLNKLVIDQKHKAACSSDEFLVKSRRLEFSYKYADT